VTVVQAGAAGWRFFGNGSFRLRFICPSVYPLSVQDTKLQHRKGREAQRQKARGEETNGGDPMGQLVKTSVHMVRVRSVALLVVAAMALSLCGIAQTNPAPTAKPANNNDVLPLGDWRGDSICVVRESACHDEKALYHVKRLPAKPGWFSLQGDKIVDGKPEMMGTGECSYDAEKHVLHCELGRGSVHLTVTGDKMEGAMLLTDKTLWRKITLKKDK